MICGGEFGFGLVGFGLRLVWWCLDMCAFCGVVWFGCVCRCGNSVVSLGVVLACGFVLVVWVVEFVV